MTPWTLRLLIANVAVFFVTSAEPGVGRFLAFVPSEVLMRPWTAFTYMFVHGGVAHLLFNMIGLFFFGPRLEQRLGDRGFLLLYFLSGLGGALFFSIFQPGSAVVGASGAVYGVLFAFAYFWPRENIYIWGVFPIEARWLALMLVAMSLYSGITGSQSGVAHFAHLGGIAVGYAYLRWRKWRHGAGRRTLKKVRKKAKPATSILDAAKGGDRDSLDRWRTIPMDRLHELNREEVEHLLQKVEEDGVDSLSPEERSFLDRMVESASG